MTLKNKLLVPYVMIKIVVLWVLAGGLWTDEEA